MGDTLKPALSNRGTYTTLEFPEKSVIQVLHWEKAPLELPTWNCHHTARFIDEL